MLDAGLADESDDTAIWISKLTGSKIAVVDLEEGSTSRIRNLTKRKVYTYEEIEEIDELAEK